MALKLLLLICRL